ncbi:unnamed protein product [Cunninghamella echinulata]
MDPNERTLMRQCVNGVCHCDFRLTITNCVEHQGLYIVYMAFIALSGLVIFIGIGIEYDRYFRKGHRLFETGSGRGLLRPKPVDCLVTFITIFNSIRLLCALLLVIDNNPTNVLARSFLFEFSWHFGYGACALYLLGIAQTLSDSHKSMTQGWLPAPKIVDIIGISFMMGPVVLHNICSIAAGALAYTNLPVAEEFTNVLYGLWFMHTITLSFTVLFAGVRLVRILKNHLTKFPPTGERYKSIRLGIFKIQSLMSVISLCLGGYSVFLLVYAILRDQVTQNSVGSIAMAAIWNFWAPLATLIGEIALIVNPKLGENTDLGIKGSSSDKTSRSNPLNMFSNSTSGNNNNNNNKGQSYNKNNKVNSINNTKSQLQSTPTMTSTFNHQQQSQLQSNYFEDHTFDQSALFSSDITTINTTKLDDLNASKHYSTTTTLKSSSQYHVAPTLSMSAFDPFIKQDASQKLNGTLTKQMFAADVDHTGVLTNSSGIPLVDSAYLQYQYEYNNNNINSSKNALTRNDTDSDIYAAYDKSDFDMKSRSSQSHLSF